MNPHPFPLRLAAVLLFGILSLCPAAAERRAAPVVEWGEVQKGVRIGLCLEPARVVSGSQFIVAQVHYENVGDAPVEVPVHVHESVNTSRLMFSGEQGGERFEVGYFVPRRASTPPRSKTLAAGRQFSERVLLQVGKIGSQHGYAGLPELVEGEDFTLQVGLCESIDPRRQADWVAGSTQKSGVFKTAVAKDPTEEIVAKLKKEALSLQLRVSYQGGRLRGLRPGLVLHPATMRFQPVKGWKYGAMSQKEAEALIDGLAEAGLFRHAVSGEGKFGGVGYVLHIHTRGSAMYEVLGEASFVKVRREPEFEIWGANGTELLLIRINCLHELLEGGARKAVEDFGEAISI